MVFGQLDIDESAIWSLLLASGYLKPDAIEYRGELLEPWYHLSITNLETRSMFSAIFKGWFKGCLLYTSPSPRDGLLSRMPSSA